MNQSPAPYNILSPNKKLSQLIAKSWLDGNRIPLGDRNFLISNDILSAKEAAFFEIIVDREPPGPPYEGYINAVTRKIAIPYPQRPNEITNEALKSWIDSPSDSPPWIPDDEQLRFLIPLTTNFVGE
ncbi:hypothetical protein [Pleurocapsa sp. PCC 7319]|uniref:hypothetical protein n=1 Tax=Pleurocapsa sp. PCC 7319 TaxID=118161 RepID=UPI00037167E7|nr:hypothetical protein [Pleurocapsa sp. PCC 7319]